MPNLVERHEPRIANWRMRFATGSSPGGVALQEVLERGVERGDLRPDLDLELALDVLGGPLFYRLLITGGPIDEQLAEGVADLILRGFAAGRATPREGPKSTKGESTMKIHAIQTGTVAVRAPGARASATAGAACCTRSSTGSGRSRFRSTPSRSSTRRA